MGCGGSKSATVVPDEILQAKSLDHDLLSVPSQKERNSKSGKSNNSNLSTDSGFDDAADSLPETEDVTLVVTAPKTVPADSTIKSVTPITKPDPVTPTKPDTEDASEPRPLLFNPNAKPGLLDDAELQEESKKDKIQRMKSPGIAFEVNFDLNSTPTRKRMPPRLKAIVTTPKRELTLLELDTKLRTAEKLRQNQINKVSRKANLQNKKVDNADQKLTRERTTLDDSVHSKEKNAIENRRKHMKDLQARLLKKEAHAKKVRARAHSGSSTRSTVSAVSGVSGVSGVSVRSESARSTASRNNVRVGSATSTYSNASIPNGESSGSGGGGTQRRASVSAVGTSDQTNA
eukprot:m.77399 g.77399  ORF g.77399 m.77399 type:complete len:346 (-) comp25010_c1_seq1:362-1399(-)